MRPSIVIRTYNEEKHIGRLLEGISRQTVEDVELILVDSGSTDATLSIASRYPVQILQIDPDEFTFGRSLNLGCKAATGDIIIIASAHVYPTYADWLEKLLEPFRDERVALVYGKQRGNKTTKFSEHQHFAKMFPDQSRLQENDPLCNNANAAIRRSLWERNPYDENLPGLEDIGWATWAIEQGYLLAYLAEAEVIHVHDEKPKEVYNRYRREALALKRIRPEGHFTVIDFVYLLISNIATDLLDASKERELGRSIIGILWFRLMQFWGTYRGFSFSGKVSGELIRTFYYPRSPNKQLSEPLRDIERIEYSRTRKGK